MRVTLRIVAISISLTIRASGFALLGPCADWMDASKSYGLPGDIGGPMNIGEGYRWNIPVVTYGFERSFLDYFGSNGVVAVEAAIEMLNQLPPASQINLEDYPLLAWRVNYYAEAASLIDLKSMALTLMLEQLGLTSPTRYTFCVRDYQPISEDDYWFAIIQRNFDPITAQPSAYVNETLFSYQIIYTASPATNLAFCDAIEFAVDPLADVQTAVTESQQRGSWVTNLSRDDVGGLRYLLSGGQVRFERLPPGVHAADTNLNFVGAAYRPGIEKLTFLRHPIGSLSGEFQRFTNRWTDIYYDGNYPIHQPVERISTYPDIVFTAQDFGVQGVVRRTGTTNWVNNADVNGNQGGAGPGVIQPGAIINFNKVGPMYFNHSPLLLDQQAAWSFVTWGSFSGNTNSLITYPSGQVFFQPTYIQFRLLVGNRTNSFIWALSGPPYSRHLFQSSTSLTNWGTLASITNSGLTFNLQFEAFSNEPSRFFRFVRLP